MNDRTKNIVTTIIAAGVGVGILYMLRRNNKKILRRIQSTYKSLKLNKYYDDLQTIVVVNTVDECKTLVTTLKKHCSEYNVVGFDCEWTTVGGSRRPVALLQLSTSAGTCGLIRLCKLNCIPQELREFLEDESILKVGIAPVGDAKYLAYDYSVHVNSCLDLRYLAPYAKLIPGGLAKMSKDYLDIELDKNWRIRCSDWEANILSESQIDYAAKDAHVAIELFKKMTNIIEPNFLCSKSQETIKIVLQLCEKYLDLNYKTGSLDRENKKNISLVNRSLNANNIKMQKRNMSTLVKPLYENCILEAPDGDILCTCDRKKADWYVLKDLATVVTLDNPYTVRLNFEPSGRAVGEVGQYYANEKVNQCVVCGSKKSYIRKNVVPKEYRKYFPIVMKEHTSHDVLLLCVHCHQISNMADLNLRLELSKLCDAPLSSQDGGAREFYLPNKANLRKAARALHCSGAKLPPLRKKELEENFLKHFPENTEITNELLKRSCEIQVSILNENYLSHGQKVVQYFQNNLIELERIWRQHFLDTMTPKHLPELWSVNHNADKLGIWSHEGRIYQYDLKIEENGTKVYFDGECSNEN